MLSMKFFKFHAGIMGERQNGAGSQKAGIQKRGGGNMKLGFSSR